MSIILILFCCLGVELAELFEFLDDYRKVMNNKHHFVTCLDDISLQYLILGGTSKGSDNFICG